MLNELSLDQRTFEQTYHIEIRGRIFSGEEHDGHISAKSKRNRHTSTEQQLWPELKYTPYKGDSFLRQ